MGILKRKKYPWEEDEDEEEEFENPADWSLREELEKAFEKADEENEEQEESNAHEQNLFSELDTSDMNLRDELEAKFDALNKNQYQTKITPDLFKADNDLEDKEEQNPFSQIYGAIKDMTKSYFDMKKDNTIGADDYFHCKANFEAANRGNYGAKTAEWLGDKKEDFDYYYNQLWKGLSQQEAEEDRLHDKRINKIARQRAKRRLYLDSKRACHPYRVRGINEKY